MSETIHVELSPQLHAHLEATRPGVAARIVGLGGPVECRVQSEPLPRFQLVFPHLTPSVTVPVTFDDVASAAIQQMTSTLVAEGWDRALDTAAPTIVLDGHPSDYGMMAL